MQHNSYHTHSNTSPTQVNSLFTCSGTLAKQILHTQTHIETQHKLKRTLCFLPLGHMQHPFLFAQIILCVEAHTNWNTQCFDLFITLDSPHYLPKHVSQEIEDKAKSRQVLSSHRDWWGIISLCFSNITSSKDGLKQSHRLSSYVLRQRCVYQDIDRFSCVLQKTDTSQLLYIVHSLLFKTCDSGIF